MPPRSLSGKRAVVTGAAQGIGQAYALRLAQDGADLVLIDKRDCSQTVDSVRGVGREATVFTCDLTDVAEIDGLTSKVIAEFGGCDILVNNAGIGSAIAFDEISRQRLKTIFALNVEAPFLLCKA